jgi:hypothetical protein
MSSPYSNIQNDIDDNDEYIKEKYLFEDNIDVFYNEDNDDFEDGVDYDNKENE